MHNVIHIACQSLASKDPAQYFGLAVFCVNWSSPTAYYLKVQEYRIRLAPQADALLEPLERYLKDGRYVLNGFRWSVLSSNQQECVRRFLDRDYKSRTSCHSEYYNSLELMIQFWTAQDDLEIWKLANDRLQ
jgi:hypothetical protein